MTAAAWEWRGLLVSVRDAAEASEAVAGGADIIDVKEPRAGPLGRAPAATAAAIARVVPRPRPWTLACGELAEGVPSIVDHVAEVCRLVTEPGQGPAGVKAGPAGLGIAAWRSGFRGVALALPRVIEPVAVAYADWRAADAPPPTELIVAAAAEGARILLIDTFDKSGPGLWAAAGSALADWVAAGRRAGLRMALAGRLEPAEAHAAMCLGVGIVGVRSAACGGARLGRVDRVLVARIVARLRDSGCRRPHGGPAAVGEGDEIVGSAGSARSGIGGSAAAARRGPRQGAG